MTSQGKRVALGQIFEGMGDLWKKAEQFNFVLCAGSKFVKRVPFLLFGMSIELFLAVKLPIS